MTALQELTEVARNVFPQTAMKMRIGRRCIQALPMLLLWHFSNVCALDVPPPGGPTESRFALDTSFDSTTLNSRSLDANLTFSPFGPIHESGLRIRLSIGESRYQYLVSDSPRTFESGNGTDASLLVGYGVSMQRVNFIALIGPSYSHSESAGVSKSYTGTRALISVYARPTDGSMTYASLSHSTIQTTTQLLAKVGFRVPRDTYFGPETHLTWRRASTRDIPVATTRIGAHLSSIRFEPWFLSLSGGWARERNAGSGGYLSVGAYGAF